MRRLRTQRGSAYLYVVACVAAMGTLLAALVPMVTQSRTTQIRQMAAAKAKLAEEAVTQLVTAEARVGALPANSVRTATVNGATATVTVTDGSAKVPNSLLLTGAGTVGDQTFGISQYITKGVSATPYSFALFENGTMDFGSRLITGASGVGGDIFSNGDIKLDTVESSYINGDASAVKNVKFKSSTVTGAVTTNANPIPFPSVSSSDYYSAAKYRLLGPLSSATGFSFGPKVNGEYEIYHITGDVTFEGLITGRGVVFVLGNVYVTGNITYGSSTDQVALIVTGNVYFNPACTQAVGIVYAGNTIYLLGSSLNVARGIFVAKGIQATGWGSGGTFQITRDDFAKDVPNEGTRLRLPGYWP